MKSFEEKEHLQLKNISPLRPIVWSVHDMKSTIVFNGVELVRNVVCVKRNGMDYELKGCKWRSVRVTHVQRVAQAQNTV